MLPGNMFNRCDVLCLVLCFVWTWPALLARAEDKWTGTWFPVTPGQQTVYHELPTGRNVSNMETTPDCDDAEHHLERDFDPANRTHLLLARCLLTNRTAYQSSYDVHPLHETEQIPTTFRPLHRCMNESIDYATDAIPTFGNHRPIWPQYGEYTYVPIQRWLHSIEHGAIVMLYHPCATAAQVDRLRQLVRGCLYRHIITASELPTAERPLVLLSWGHRLAMSAVDEEVVRSFIRANAKRGLETYAKNGGYAQLLIAEADVLTTIEDGVLCPVK